MGIAFHAVVVDVEELTEGDPAAVAAHNARVKGRAVAPRADASGPALVLGVDTVVAIEGRILPKPADPAQARQWLEALSGREHRVISAICLIGPDGEREARSTTTVRFRHLSAREIDWYVATGEWRDRAGGYAIQGRGAALVEAIEGDYWTVVGLPVPALLDLLGTERLLAG